MAKPAHRREGVLDVTVVLMEAGFASEAIGPIEVFHSAGRLWHEFRGEPVRPRFRVRTVSINGKPVVGRCGVALKPDAAIADVRRTDLIMVPASGWHLEERILRDTPLVPWLRKWHSKGAYVAGICTGVAFLAESGLLDGREATTHWAAAEAMKARYPTVKWRADQFVTEDHRVFCSGGVYAAIDLALHLVEKFCGHEVALQCARSLVVSMPRSLQSGYSVLPLSRPHGDERIRTAERHFQENRSRSLSIDAVAEAIGMSRRNFIRRFKAATGRLPGAYVQMLRMSAARELLERGDLAVQTVCARVGYEDAAFFRSVFKRHTGMTPAEYRRRFARMTFERGELASR